MRYKQKSLLRSSRKDLLSEQGPTSLCERKYTLTLGFPGFCYLHTNAISNSKIEIFHLRRSFLGVLVILCCITDHPKTWWLTIVLLFSMCLLIRNSERASRAPFQPLRDTLSCCQAPDPFLDCVFWSCWGIKQTGIFRPKQKRWLLLFVSLGDDSKAVWTSFCLGVGPQGGSGNSLLTFLSLKEGNRFNSRKIVQDGVGPEAASLWEVAKSG